jgi:hypothetical protein
MNTTRSFYIHIAHEKSKSNKKETTIKDQHKGAVSPTKAYTPPDASLAPNTWYMRAAASPRKAPAAEDTFGKASYQSDIAPDSLGVALRPNP